MDEVGTLDVVGGRLFHVQCRSVCDIYSISRSGLEEATHERPMILDELKSKAEQALHVLSKKLKLSRRIQILEAIRSRRDTIHRESIVVASQDLHGGDQRKGGSFDENSLDSSADFPAKPPQWAIELQKSINSLRKEMRRSRSKDGESKEEEVAEEDIVEI